MGMEVRFLVEITITKGKNEEPEIEGKEENLTQEKR